MAKCAGRTGKGRVKKGYKVVAGKACPVKVGGTSRRKAKRASGRARGVAKHSGKVLHCTGLVKGGKKFGKLKKGWKFVGGSVCPKRARKR